MSVSREGNYRCMLACYRQINTCMWHLFCKVNPPTCISTRDRHRYWTGAGVSTERRGARGWIDILKGYWTGAGVSTERRGARGWINILKGYWTGAGVSTERRGARGWIDILKGYWPGAGVSTERRGAREGKGRAQRQDRGRCLSRKAGRPVRDQGGIKAGSR